MDPDQTAPTDKKIHSFTFYIELFSKCVGVALNLTLLKDN